MLLDDPPDTAALFMSDESDDEELCASPSTAELLTPESASKKRALKSDLSGGNKTQRTSPKKKARKPMNFDVSKAKDVVAKPVLSPGQTQKLDALVDKLYTRRLRLAHALDRLPPQPKNMSLRELELACPPNVLAYAQGLLETSLPQHVVKRLCKERRTGIIVVPKRKRPPAKKRARAPRKRVKKVVDPRTREELHSIYKANLAKVKFPIVEKTLTLFSVGSINTQPGFSSPRNIWPIGFKSERMYPSAITKDTKVKYTSEIVEGPEGPLFHVTASDNPDFVIIQKTATSAWRHMWMHLAKAGTDKVVSNKGHAPSGPDMFGYSRKTVTNLIEGLDGALDVKDYVFYAHRHNVGRRSLTGEKKPKKPRNKANTKRGRRKITSELVAARQLRDSLLQRVKRSHNAQLLQERMGMLRCWREAQSNAKQRLREFVQSDEWQTTFEYRTPSTPYTSLMSRWRTLSSRFQTQRGNFGPESLQVYHMLSKLGHFIGLKISDITFQEFSTVLINNDDASINLLTKVILSLVKAVTKTLCYSLDNEQGKSHTAVPYRTHENIFVPEALQDLSVRLLLTIARRVGGHTGGRALDNLRLGFFSDSSTSPEPASVIGTKIYCSHRKPKDILTRKCQALWRSIWMHPRAAPFKPPIDCSIYVHYLTSVPTPMCLFDVHNKMIIGEYSRRRGQDALAGARLFQKDMRLIFSNCKTFNATDSKLWKDADELDKIFERLFKAWIHDDCAKVESWDDPKIWDNKNQDWCMLCRLNYINEENQENLVCDGCDGEFHRMCLWPPLSVVPIGDWYCPACVEERAAKKTTFNTAVTHPSCLGMSMKKLSDIIQFPPEFFDASHCSPVFRNYDTVARCDTSLKEMMPLHIKTQQQRYQAIGSIVKLAQRLSSVPDLTMLKPSEKLDALDLLCNEVLMTKPMRQVLDNRLKEVQTAQHARHRELRMADTAARSVAAEMMTTMAKKRKRNQKIRKLARLAAKRTNSSNENDSRPFTPVIPDKERCESPGLQTITGMNGLPGRMSPQDMLGGPPPLCEFGINDMPVKPLGKRIKKGRANGLSPPRRRKTTSRPAHKPKKPRSAYQFFVKERWQHRLNASAADGQTKRKDRKRMQKETKLFAKLWKEFVPEKKRKFEIMCTDDKARYKREMFSYIPPLAPKEETETNKATLSIIYFNTLLPRKLLFANSKFRWRRHPVPFEVTIKMPLALRPYLAGGSAGQQAASTWLGGIVEPDKINVKVLSLGKVAGDMSYWCSPMTLLPVGYHAITTLRTCTLEVQLHSEVIDVDGAPRFKLSTSKGYVPSVTSIKASPDEVWREALSQFVSKITLRGGKPFSRLRQMENDNSSSTDEEEAAANVFLDFTADTNVDKPIALPTPDAGPPTALPTPDARPPTELPTPDAGAPNEGTPSTPVDHTRVWAESAFGLDMFGLRSPAVRRVIEGLPNAILAKDYLFEEELAVAQQLQPPPAKTFAYNPPPSRRHPAWTGFLRMRMTQGELSGNAKDDLKTSEVDTSKVSPIFMCASRKAEATKKTDLCNFCNKPAHYSKNHMVTVMNMPRGANFEVKLHQECAHTVLDVFYERMSKFHDGIMRQTRSLSHSDIFVKFQEQMHMQAVRSGKIGKDRHGNSFWFFGQDISTLFVLCKPPPLLPAAATSSEGSETEDEYSDRDEAVVSRDDAAIEGNREGIWRVVSTVKQYQELIHNLSTSVDINDRVLTYMLRRYQEQAEAAMSVGRGSKTAAHNHTSGLTSLRVWKMMQLKDPDYHTYYNCEFCAATARPKEWHCRYCHVTFVRPKAKFLQHQAQCATLAHPAVRCTKTLHDIKEALLIMEALLPWKQLRKQKEFCWVGSKRAAWNELVRYADGPRQLWLSMSVLEMQIPQAWLADWWLKTATVSRLSDLPQNFSESQLFLRLCMLDKAIKYSILFANDPCAAVKRFALKCVTIKHYRT